MADKDACSPHISHVDVTSKHPSRRRAFPKRARTMPSFSFPHAYDPQMHREDILTLSRTTSQQNATSNVNGTAKPSLAPAPAMTSKPPAKDTPASLQRRHYVFADPVAFRWVKANCSTQRRLTSQVSRGGLCDGSDRTTRQASRLRAISC